MFAEDLLAGNKYGLIGTTVDGRNPKQPPVLYQTLSNISSILTGAGFLPSTVGY